MPDGLEAAVADVLPGGAETSIVEEPVSTESPDGGSPAGESEEQAGAEDQASKPEPTEDVQDGRVLSPDLRSHLKELKAVNPQLEKKIRGAFFALDSLKKEFPQGVREAVELKKALGEFGGVEKIKEAQADVQYYLDVDAKIEKGDPAVIDTLAEMLPTDAFSGFASKFLNTFYGKDPDGFQRVISGYIANTFAQSGFEHYMARAIDAIDYGKPENAKALLQQIATWAGGFGEIAAKKPEPKPVDARQQELDTRAKELDSRETQQFTQGVSGEIGTWSSKRVMEEAAPFLKGRKLNQDQTETLELRALGRVRNSLRSDQQFSEAYTRYFTAKDREGLLKLVKSATDKLLPAAVKESYRALFSDFSGKKEVAAPGTNGAQVAPKPVPAGWTKISAPPSPDSVNLKASPVEMRMRSGAILKDGRKVFWGSQPPA